MSTHDKPPILVTGAGRRVGLHIAQRLLDDGHPVIAHYHRPSEAIEALVARGAIPIQAAFDRAEGAHALVAAVRGQAVSLRAIVHNASAFTPTPTDMDAADAMFEHFFSIHMRTPYLINNGLIDLLRAAAAVTPTDIVHITDIFAVSPNPAFDIYCATKAGLENLSRSFAMRYAPQVKVNTLQPGPILFKDSHTEAMRQRVLAETPLGREGGPEAVYRALRALLDNDYLTGTAIQVDGGRHLTR
ncbi:SDR family oxidoreductase [Acidihalobacter prosperus]|uniref:Dihydromonapterin reductase n=1 Tax=Acidihalobacter prosperus TaxID=160660 RepID=A0A1A6C535_9GAMM|nr:SDR family oxidoreductase [Acidihalobacter prosperus]OBS09672.1 SDR family oxidoreductase [Acidihalobacter prosperus]